MNAFENKPDTLPKKKKTKKCPFSHKLFNIGFHEVRGHEVKNL